VRGVLRGPSGEKVGRALDVEAEPASTSNGIPVPGTTIRRLVRGEDGAPTYAMRFFESSPGSKVEVHSHPWEHEIYVLRGSMRATVGPSAYELEEGDFIFIPPGVEHDFSIGDRGSSFICTIPLRPTAAQRHRDGPRVDDRNSVGLEDR
jgi:quercetin dioxygenase-like cupin family protein